MSMAHKKSLYALGDALRGDSITASPVVTRDVLIGVVRRQNNCLGVLREGCDLLVNSLEVVKEQQRLALVRVGAVDTTLGLHEARLDELGRRFEKMDTQVSHLWKQMDKLSALEIQQQEQVLQASELQCCLQKLTWTREQEANENKEQFEAFRGAIATQDQSILMIQDKLSRLSKELYISSDQVHVVRRPDLESDAVFDKPAEIERDGASRASLTNELECMSTMAQEMARNMELQRRMATTQSKQLELKACKETEAIANQNKEHLGKMQEFLNSNMDVNLMDIRRNQDLILSQLEDYHMLLDEKTTEGQVDSRIERRYDDFVSHLQLAMQSVKDDEANFKACIQRIEQASSQLMTNKAERSELNELRAQLEVQLANSTKASQELSPEARTLLQSAVQREEILTMLKDKADKSLMDILSTQTTSLLESSDKLAMQSEQGDALLDSRLSALETIQSSLYPQANRLPASQTQNLLEQCDSAPILQDSIAEKATSLPYINGGVDSRKNFVQETKTVVPSSSLQESDSMIPSFSLEMLPKKRTTLKSGPSAPRAPLVSFLQPQSSP